MDILLCALALLSGVIGAGFASGREILRFFSHPAAVLSAVLTLFFFFVLLPERMERFGVQSLSALCAKRFGKKLGMVCTVLFVLLGMVTGGAMLSACAELTALILPVHHAYAFGMVFSLIFGFLLAARGIPGLAFIGAALLAVLPVLLVRLLFLPAGEAVFSPGFPLHALTDGMIYGALNAAMLAGALPLLLTLSKPKRKKSVLLFCLLFGVLLALGSAVCRRHRSLIAMQPLPFVFLSRALSGGYLLTALCLYGSALSTFCAMLCAVSRLLPFKKTLSLCAGTSGMLLFALWGFGAIVQSAYPIAGAICAALLLLLCLPG